jgi:hypothetical protein
MKIVGARLFPGSRSGNHRRDAEHAETIIRHVVRNSLRPPRLCGETILTAGAIETTDQAAGLRHASGAEVGHHRRGAEHAETIWHERTDREYHWGGHRGSEAGQSVFSRETVSDASFSTTGTSLRPPRLRGETIMTEDPIAGCKREGAMVPGVPRSGNHRRGAEDAETKIRRVVLNWDVSASSAPPR